MPIYYAGMAFFEVPRRERPLPSPLLFCSLPFLFSSLALRYLVILRALGRAVAGRSNDGDSGGLHINNVR